MVQIFNEGCKTLYVGHLDARVTDTMLEQIFSMISPVDHVKIVKDPKASEDDLNYGLVEFCEHQGAEQALHAMGGRIIFGQEISVKWETQGSTTPTAQKEDTSRHYRILVGDLSPDVNDEELSKAFAPFPSMSDARVMWDQTTGKSRGFGYVAFRDKAEAEEAMDIMDGEYLGSGAVKCNWANQKNVSPSVSTTTSAAHITKTEKMQVASANMSYEDIFAQTPPYNTTIFIGNLPQEITPQDIAPYFQQYGFVSDIRLQNDKGVAFVKLDTHANAATAIFALQGFNIGGKAVKLSWGKDRPNHTSEPTAPPPLNYYAPGYRNNGWFQPITGTYDMHTMRPPAPVAGTPSMSGGEEGGGIHGWNQYYHTYYSAGHQSI
ncbi:uncharacterized protein BYT42DRAFT_562968 [Radiomyces spectabilis]|uniref:uncharacterized protein n=1 Tax=Radiomyces spectabilis TaxID=64574 RepID=UPI00221F8FC3|nr:uncharacterized protein BYT42DRAFT_562968 [Radiomyces spectabilis]KAI8384580.1 hypothetical protein BYT42DRAFT_562968 [Radiomyces spectabilis]